MAYDLTNLYISQSYKQLLQVSASNVTDGTGSLISTLYLNGDKVITQTNIAAISATTGSIAALNTFTGSAVYRSGSFTGSFTGSFLGSVVSSSYSFTASSAVTSFTSISSSVSVSSSYAFTASSAISSSFATLSSTASYVASVISSSYAYTASSAVSSSFAITASYALNGGSGGSGFPFTGSARITGSLDVTGSIKATNFTGSLFGTASYVVSSSYAYTASSAVSASYATTAGTVSITGQVAASGSAGGSNQSMYFIAGGGQTYGVPPSITINIPALTGRSLGTTAFVTAVMTGSSAVLTNNYIAIDNMDNAGNIKFVSQGAVQFTFTGIYI